MKCLFYLFVYCICARNLIYFFYLILLLTVYLSLTIGYIWVRACSFWCHNLIY